MLSLQSVLLLGLVRRFRFRSLAGRTAPAPDRPQVQTYAPNYSASLTVSRSHKFSRNQNKVRLNKNKLLSFNHQATNMNIYLALQTQKVLCTI